MMMLPHFQVLDAAAARSRSTLRARNTKARNLADRVLRALRRSAGWGRR